MSFQRPCPDSQTGARTTPGLFATLLSVAALLFSGCSYLTRFILINDTDEPATVVIKLKQAWAGFPFLLTVGPGLIASPAAIQKAGASFATAPGDAGAGPFVLSSFKAGEAAVFKKNPTYFGGSVYLDELRFVVIGAADQTYIALKNNTIQAAYLRDPVAQAEAKKDGFVSVLIPSPGGNIALMNSGVEVTCTGGVPASVCVIPTWRRFWNDVRRRAGLRSMLKTS